MVVLICISVVAFAGWIAWSYQFSDRGGQAQASCILIVDQAVGQAGEQLQLGIIETAERVLTGCWGLNTDLHV